MTVELIAEGAEPNAGQCDDYAAVIQDPPMQPPEPAATQDEIPITLLPFAVIRIRMTAVRASVAAQLAAAIHAEIRAGADLGAGGQHRGRREL